MLLCLCFLATVTACGTKKEKVNKPEIDDQTVTLEKLYTVSDADGRLRLEFTDDMEAYWAAQAETTPTADAYVFFSSVAEMKERITSKKLTAEELTKLYRLKSQGFKLDMDMSNLCEINIPSDTKKEVCWKGSEYQFSLSGSTAYGAIFPCSQEDYADVYEKEFTNYPELTRNTTILSRQILENGKTIEILYTTRTAKIKVLLYDVKIPDGVLHVRESYCLERFNGNTGSVSESIPQHIYLLCQDDENYFVGKLYDLTTRPTQEWLASFGVYAVTGEELNISDFLKFESGATTKEQVVAAIGPCHETCRTAFVHEIYHTSDGESISVCYSADGTVDLIAKCSWDGNSYYNTEILVTRKIYVSDFLAFQAGVTTREQVTGKVGSCQEHYGSGFIEELYYTYDGAIISVYFSPDQTVGYIMELARDGKYYTIKNRLVE